MVWRLRPRAAQSALKSSTNLSSDEMPVVWTWFVSGELVPTVRPARKRALRERISAEGGSEKAEACGQLSSELLLMNLRS
jgi:hypothetical protein